ncbi:MAG TPA: ABC transporter substrate-binding protein [Chloroflexota bacterium]
MAKPSAPAAAASAAASGAAPAASGASAAAKPSAIAASGGPTQAQTIAGATIQPLPQRAPIRASVNFTAFYVIPIYWAMDKGYFQKAGLDINLELARVPSTIPPRLARGELDISDTPARPALFNATAEGFNTKLISSLTELKPGRTANVWLMVDKDKPNPFKQISDLKGKTIEAGIEGGPLDFVIIQTLKDAGLVAGKDVTVTHRAKSPTDTLPLAKAKAYDAIAVPEPVASQVEAQGIAVRWKADAETVPWYQALLLAASEQILQKNRPAVVKFLDVYVATAREINASNGAWSDDVLNTTAKWTDLPVDVLKQMGGVPYSEPNGNVSMDSLKRVQDTWVQLGIVAKPVDLSQIVDPGPLQDALKDIGSAK